MFGRVSLQLLLVVALSTGASGAPVDVPHVVYLGDAGVIVIRLEVHAGGKTPQQNFEQFVDDLFQRLDENKDGVVTVEEAFGKYLTARQAMQAQLIPQRDPAPADASPDSSPADGKITKSEWLAYYRRMGLHPFVVTYQASPTVAGRPGTNANLNPLFARLDLNRDGKLSAAELTATLLTLRKMDLDDDETISAAELTPISNNPNFVQPVGGNNRAVATSPFLSLGADESLQKQIRRLIDKYDSTDPGKSSVAGSQIRNQKLSPQELGIPVTEFAQFDGDGDGQLDFDELRQFLTSPPPMISLTINVDGAEPLKAESHRAELQEKLRTSDDGAANINLGTTQLSLLRSTYSIGGSAENLIKPQFMAADTDANGYLEKSEAERAFLFGATFEDLDTDKNGKIFLDEATAYFQVRLEAARCRTVLSINEQGRTLFEILDTDRDRRLSFRELKIAADKLSLWDKDGDGLLSENEIPLQYRLTIARGNLPVFGGVAFDPGLNASGTPTERTAGPLWFRKMDKNRDGEVSRREFLGEVAQFEKIDQNHDGFIDLSEALLVVAE